VGTKSLAAVGLWLAVVGAGFGWLAVYESRPGAAADGPRDWPADSRLAREPGRWTLVLFLHPRCPCSKATLEELAELTPRFADRLRTYAVFCKPEGTPEGWEQTAMWRQAASIGGVTACSDEGDAERRRFGARTSGQVFLYDGKDGRLRSCGGITRARGMAGPNAGRRAVESLLSGRPAAAEGPVYGCPLVDEP
jgi:hypothetical protein